MEASSTAYGLRHMGKLIRFGFPPYISPVY
jgi:hypothetical protein